MSVLLLIAAAGAAATAALAVVGRLAFELRARAAMRTLRARGERTEVAELRRRVLDRADTRMPYT